MSSIPSRDLRNDVSAVLRRVEAGERLTVTVSGRAVARLVPVERPTWVSGERLAQVLSAPADRALLTDLATLLPDTTDDLPT